MKIKFNNIIKLLQVATITSFLFPHRWRTATRTMMWCYGCGRWCAGKRNIAMRTCTFRTITILRNHYCVSPLPRCDSHLKVNTVIILLSLQKNKYWLMIYFFNITFELLSFWLWLGFCASFWHGLWFCASIFRISTTQHNWSKNIIIKYP